MTSSLSDVERNQLQSCVDDFRATRTRGAIADWEPYLAGLSPQLRFAALAEFVGIDLTHRWQQGERPQVEEYVLRFPEIGLLDRLPASVVLSEHRCRVNAGERYDPEGYRKRFPLQFPEVQGLLESVASPGATTETLVGAPRFPTPAYAQTLLPGAPGSVAQSGTTSSATGEYEFLRMLGRGVFGEVWLARKRTSGIEKAIKILSQPVQRDAAQRELRSLELIKNLRHPYLLSTEDFWVSEQRLHIVMEVAEYTLRDRIDQCRGAGGVGIPEGELLGYIREAAEGLDFLHAKHIVHRDVKPDNILILNGHAKVADFGLAWRQDQMLSPMKTFAGTPAYMAPEVWGKEGGPASDQYSLAVTYIEMRQGHPPFLGQQIEDMRTAHLEGSQAFEPIIGEAERQVLTRALARQTEGRYPSCMAFVEDLSLALGIPVVSRSGAGGGSFSGMGSLGSRPAGPLAETLMQQETVRSKAGRPLAPTGTGVQPSSSKKKQFAALAGIGLLAIAGIGAWAVLGNRGSPEKDPSTVLAPKGDEVKSTPSLAASDPRPSGQANDPKPASNPVVLPARAQPDPLGRELELVDGRRVYDWVVIPVDAENVRFRLIFGGPDLRPVRPFYMMESKVWNNLFREGKGTVPPASDMNGLDAPVTGVTAKEAADFAHRVFGGMLPSPDEWDTAAGLYATHSGDEVTGQGGRPRVFLAKPEATHGPKGKDDIKTNGLRDMAGNGREWTRKVLTASGERDIAAGPLAATDRVVLRGRAYTMTGGLTFSMLKAEQTQPQTQFAGVGSPYTSFRVAVPIP